MIINPAHLWLILKTSDLVSVAALVFFAGISFCPAEDWTTPEGKTYSNVTIVSHDSAVVTISYGHSETPIPPSGLSKAIQQGIYGTVTLPISKLGKDFQQRILNDNSTALKLAAADGKTDKYVKAVSDLCSSSPEVRSQAAKTIRDDHLYKPTPRASWDKLASELNEGETYQKAIAYLHKYGVALQLEVEYSPPNEVFHFRLDDSWVLACAFNQSVLTEYKVIEEPLEIKAYPPAQYSGFWRIYLVNGESPRSLYYINGKPILLDAH